MPPPRPAGRWPLSPPRPPQPPWDTKPGQACVPQAYGVHLSALVTACCCKRSPQIHDRALQASIAAPTGLQSRRRQGQVPPGGCFSGYFRFLDAPCMPLSPPPSQQWRPLPSLRFSLLSFKDSCDDDTGATWLIQDSLPISKSLTESQWQSSFCHERSHTHRSRGATILPTTPYMP